MKEKLKNALAERPKQRIIDANRVSAAVLVPIFLKDGEYHLLFTKRTEKVKDHKGQISFPGGACEVSDGTPANTALRECAEEVGLGVGSVEILGELDDEVTVTSRFIITPFVAFISSLDETRVEPTEVEETIEIPISALLECDCAHEQMKNIDGQTTISYSYNYRGKVIWGATARILNQFLEIYARVMATAK